MSQLLPIPYGARHSCIYNATCDRIEHHISLNGHHVMLRQDIALPSDDFLREWEEACKRLVEAAQPQLRVTGLVRAMLPAGYKISKFTDLFCLEGPQYSVALFIGHEADQICDYCMLPRGTITQEQFDGEYRRASSQVRSAALAARASYNAPGAFSPLASGAFGAPFSPLSEPARKATSIERCAPRVGEIVAYRAWFWDKIARTLASVGKYPFWWLPGKIVQAESLEGEHLREDNCCGVWSFKNQNGPVHEYMLAGGSGYYATDTAREQDLLLVLGTCWIWGTIIEHERGYRSQFGTVRSLDSLYCTYGSNWQPDYNAEGFLSELRAFYKLRRVDHAD